MKPKIKNILGYPPMIFTGVECSGKKTTIKNIISLNKPFIIAKQFTTNFNLTQKHKDFYVYLNEKEFDKLISTNSYLTYLKSQDGYYEGYFKEPLHDSISKSNCVNLMFMNYDQYLKYKQFSERFLIDYISINIIPETPILLAENLFNEKYSKIDAKNDDENELLYENLHKEVNNSGDQISKLYKREGLFDITITNNYKNESLILQMNEILNTCYPFLFDKI